jgi:ABC-type transport system involved in cytochrome bd biosynthesis fused ATPase/permease subunit
MDVELIVSIPCPPQLNPTLTSTPGSRRQELENTPRAVAVEGRPMLQLLRACSGAFRPGVLTALVGSSGAGKTTLMDVIAGRKTSAPAPPAPAPRPRL